MTEQQKQKLEFIHQLVSSYLDRNHAIARVTHLYLDPESRAHLVNCGTSILAAKNELNYNPGSFADAIIRNDFMQVVSRADSTNLEALRFYAMLIYNTPEKISFTAEVGG